MFDNLFYKCVFLVTQSFQNQFGKVKMNFPFSEIEALAEATIGQHKNDKWYMERVGRILGSSMRDTIILGHELQQHKMTKSSKLS